MRLIAKEVLRSQIVEGFDLAHDDKHSNGELMFAAIDYASIVAWPEFSPDTGKPMQTSAWPFGKKWWKPSPDPIRNLIKAGALLAAEISRLRRAEAPGRPKVLPGEVKGRRKAGNP